MKSLKTRTATLHKVADGLREHKKEMAEIMTREMGANDWRIEGEVGFLRLYL